MNTRLRVLLVEDNPHDAELTLLALRRSGFDPHITRAETEADYRGLLGPDIDIILSDFALPQFDGIRALEILKDSSLDIPFILISGTVGEETAVQAMKTGATDYLLKDRLARLGEAVRHAIRENEVRRSHQRALVESARRLELAIQAAGMGVWEVAIPSGSLWCDPRTCAICGTDAAMFDDRKQSVDFMMKLLVHPEDFERVRARFHAFIRSAEGSFDEEFRIIRPDTGEQRIVHSRGITFCDESGSISRAVGVQWDVTKERTREKELKKALAYEKILTHKAQAGERAKGEFLATMSHEIRTPMNGIIGFAQMLVEAQNLAEDCKDCAQTILLSGEALLRIIDDVLDFSSLDAGQLRLQNAPFSPMQVVAAIRTLLAPITDRKSLTFDITASNVPEFVVGDAGRLRQILLNLAGNAAKFTQKGGIAIHIDSKNSAKDSVILEFLVQDTGPGIAPSKIGEIFNPFSQADSALSRKHGGMGLGLSISRSLANLMDGSLTVDSEEGAGTSFRLRVTFKSFSDIKPLAARSDLEVDTSFSTRYPLNILAVEDDKFNLKLILALLRKLGYDPVAASNGKEAVEAFRAHRPDCVLMDLQMPEMDGHEAAMRMRRIENDSKHSASFIAAITANVVPEDRQRCFDLGMNAYLNKPINRAELMNTLARAATQAFSS